MPLLLLLLLALTPLASARNVSGPWASGTYLTLAADSLLVHAAWIEQEQLKYARSADGGRSWSQSETVAPKVESGDSGQIRPELGLSAERQG